MKKLFLTTLLFCSFLLSAKELKLAEIQKCYSESYKYESVGKYTEAIRSLKDVYDTYPKTYTVNFRLGWLYYQNKSYANALENLEKALLVYSSSIEVLNIMNLIYAARSEWANVEQQSLKIIKLDYYNTYANYWFSVSLRMQGKLSESTQVSRKMLSVFPTSISFLQELGIALISMGITGESKSIFESLTILDPNNEIAKSYLKTYTK